MFYLYMHKENDIRDALNIINKLNMGDSEYITYTDSDRSRIALVRLKAALNKVPGILILYKISYLGQTTTAICRELSWLKERQIITIFIEYPSTWTIDEKLNQNGLSVVLDVFQNQTKSQAYPASSAPLPGRKKIEFPENWSQLYEQWERKEITAREFIERSGLKKGTFYHLVTEYKELQTANQNKKDVG